MVCDRCGADVPQGMGFCVRCGAAVPRGKPETVGPVIEGGTFPVPQIPAASRKSGGVWVVLAAVASVLAVILGCVWIWWLCQGWPAPEEQPQHTTQTQETEPTQTEEPEETEPTQPEATEPELDPSLDAFQWEGMTVYLPKEMYEYCWNVDFMQYAGTDLLVQVTSLEITKNVPVKTVAERVVRQSKKNFIQLELYQEDGAYYSEGLRTDGYTVEITGYYAAIDRAYLISVMASDDQQREEMIRIATTAKMDANVVPKVHTEGYIAYSSTSQIALDGLTMTLPETVKLHGYKWDGSVTYQNDTYTLSLYRGDMVDDLGQVLPAVDALGQLALSWRFWEGEVHSTGDVPYLVYEGQDGYLCVIGCLVKDGDYWLVTAESDTQSTTAEALAQIVTLAELADGA